MMNTQPPQPGLSGSKSSRLAGTSSNTLLIGTQQECRKQLVQRDAANAATRNLTKDAHFKIVRKIGSSMNKKQHAVGCKYIHTMVNSRQLTVYHTAGTRWQLRDQCIAGHDGKPPWSTKAAICTVRQIQRHDVISAGIFTDEFPDMHPREGMKQAVFTWEGAMEVYVVEVIAVSHCLKQQRISCRYSTCPLRWHGKKVVYSWNGPTCAWTWTWAKWPRKCFCAPQ